MHTWPLVKKKTNNKHLTISKADCVGGYLCKAVAVWYGCGVWGVGVWV